MMETSTTPPLVPIKAFCISALKPSEHVLEAYTQVYKLISLDNAPPVACRNYRQLHVGLLVSSRALRRVQQTNWGRICTSCQNQLLSLTKGRMC